ncbi:uncharacterized protein LOC119373368 [Rhipicephalus sanguineus]|uniref:uncharacterized protein LOC119373368 n=1 Tax=Rhipicephalus sanguineus TaxID=34632 RepID=UPI001893C099|nr:uncharacterized protein LOC119373368 [Rhipicephalus sanguineus]
MSSIGLSSSLLVLFGLLLGQCSAQLKSRCKIQDLRDCGSDYVVYSNATRLAEGGPEFQRDCELYLKQIDCSKKFGDRCLQNIARVVTMLALNAAEEDFEAACTEGNERQQLYMSSIKCMNSVGSKLNVCIKSLYEGLQTAVANAQRDEIVYYSCCSYHSTVDCVEAALAKCDEPDSPAREYITSTMERVFGQVLSLVCGPYSRGSASCQELPSLPPLAVNAARTPSLVELAIEIATSLRKKP